MKRNDSILRSLFSPIFSRRGLFDSSTLRLFDSRDHRPGLFHSSTLRLFDSRDHRPGLFHSSTLRLFDSDERERRSAFTLIELIAVMGIIVALALIVAGGYGGISNAIAEGQSTRQFRDALLLARQTACVNGTRIYMFVLNENEFVMCRKIGTSSYGPEKAVYQEGDAKFKEDAFWFRDYYTDLSSFVNQVDRDSESSGSSNDSHFKDADLSSQMYLFDFDKNESEAVNGILRGVEKNKIGWTLYWKRFDGSSSDGGYFSPGHDYGIALFPVRTLPKGYVFAEDNIRTCVYFEPTGEAGPGTRDHEYTIVRQSMQSDSQFQHKVIVEHGGKIKVPQPK